MKHAVLAEAMNAHTPETVMLAFELWQEKYLTSWEKDRLGLNDECDCEEDHSES